MPQRIILYQKYPNIEVEIAEEIARADMSVTEEALILARSRTNPNKQSVFIIAIKTINYRTQTETISAYSSP